MGPGAGGGGPKIEFLSWGGGGPMYAIVYPAGDSSGKAGKVLPTRETLFPPGMPVRAVREPGRAARGRWVGPGGLEAGPGRFPGRAVTLHPLKVDLLEVDHHQGGIKNFFPGFS